MKESEVIDVFIESLSNGTYDEKCFNSQFRLRERTLGMEHLVLRLCGERSSLLHTSDFECCAYMMLHSSSRNMDYDIHDCFISLMKHYTHWLNLDSPDLLHDSYSNYYVFMDGYGLWDSRVICVEGWMLDSDINSPSFYDHRFIEYVLDSDSEQLRRGMYEIWGVTNE